MSASGTKRTSMPKMSMSASGDKRTCPIRNDLKQTFKTTLNHRKSEPAQRTDSVGGRGFPRPG